MTNQKVALEEAEMNEKLQNEKIDITLPSSALSLGSLHPLSVVKNELEEQLGGRKLSEVCIAAAGRVLKTAVGHGEYEFQENTLINQEYIHSIDLLTSSFTCFFPSYSV